MEKNDGPDTISLEDEAAPWASTQVEDVFDPAVRVTLGWRDVEAAVEQGAVVPAQAHALWAGWASQGAPQRMAQSMPPDAVVAKTVVVEPLLPPMAATQPGRSPGMLLGLTLAAALAGGLLSYALFAG